MSAFDRNIALTKPSNEVISLQPTGLLFAHSQSLMQTHRNVRGLPYVCPCTGVAGVGWRPAARAMTTLAGAICLTLSVWALTLAAR